MTAWVRAHHWGDQPPGTWGDGCSWCRGGGQFCSQHPKLLVTCTEDYQWLRASGQLNLTQVLQ